MTYETEIKVNIYEFKAILDWCEKSTMEKWRTTENKLYKRLQEEYKHHKGKAITQDNCEGW